MRRLLAIGIFVAACGSGAATTPGPTDTPTPTGYSDAEKEALVRDNIDVVYCGSKPVASWCQYLGGGVPSIHVTATSLFVDVVPATPATAADDICKALAFASFDDNAEPIGYYHVHIGDGLADCDVQR